MLKNVLKKSVVWLVLVCMLCSFAPVSAFATNEAPNIIIRNDTGVSTRGDVPSGNVSEPSATAPSTDVTIDTEAELVAALAAGQKDILLGGNVTLSATLNVNAQKLCTLDLGGYTLTNENGYAINNTARSLTVSNGTVIGGIQNASTLYVDDDVKVVTNTVNGACVSGSGENHIYGTLLADAEGAVCINTAGNLEVSGATLTSKQGTAIVFNDTTGTIENSTVVGKTGAISVAKGALTIAGGSFSSEANVVTVNGGNLVINGGTFTGETSNIATYVTNGATVVVNNETCVKNESGLQKIVEVSTYAELVAALGNSAVAGIVLTADITAEDEINGTDAVIDLGGHTLTLTVGGSYFFGDSFVSNGKIDITGCVASGDCIIGIGYSNDATLTLNGVNIVGDGYSSAYAVLYVYNASTLNINGGSIVVANDNASAGGVIKAEQAADGKVNITGTAADPVELSFTNAKIGFLDGTVVFDRVDLDIVGGANAINQSLLTVKNSTLDISGCDGRALTLSQGDVTIIASELNFSDCSEGEIRFKKGLELSVDASSKIQPCTVYADTSASGANINGNAVTGTEAKPDTVVVVNGSTGVYAINGTVTPGYAASTYINGVPAIYGEATANPNESLVIKIYCGETLLGTVRLNPEKLSEVFPSAATVTKNVTWHAAFAADGDDYWITEWEENALTSSKVPTSVSLYVDGVKVGDNVVRMSGPDGINPVKWRLLDGVVVDNLEGEGTASNPYLIYNIKDLAFFRDSVNAGNTYNGKYVKVTASEIDLANNEWTPIGYMGKSFQGNFDGNGVTIKNLKITKGLDNTAANNGIGFFGRTDSPATIANITIENVDVSGSLYVGAVVGYGYTGNAVKNVTVKGDIAIDAWWYAGVIGGNGYMSLVDNCHVIGNNGSYIKGNDGSYIGGIWGFRGEGAQKITNCSVKNIDITGVDRVGGISGIAHYGNTISGVTVEGVKVSATDASATTVGLIAGACQGTESEPSVFEDITVKNVTATVGGADKTATTKIYGSNISGDAPVTNYVAEANGVLYESVIDAILAAIEAGASKVKLLKDVTEKMPTDVEIILNADLTITADKAVSVVFYNEGTSYDFVVGSNNNNTLTIGENVTFQLEDRIIWLGYYGNNVDVVVKGTLAGSQIWHGADTTVTATGTLKTTGEALVMRRGATLTVNGGKVDANYFNILAGNIVATNATITSGPIWVANTGNYDNEGGVTITLDNSNWTSSGNIKLATEKEITVTIQNGSTLSATGSGYGASVIDGNTTVTLDNGSLSLKALTNNGALELKRGSTLVASDNVTGNGSIVADATSSVDTENEAVASVNGVLYYSLAAAINAAEGAEVVLLGNVTEVVNVVNGAVVTIDMNDCTLIGSILAPNATLTIVNGSIVNTDTSKSALEINAGTLTLTNVNIDSARHALRIDGAVTATVNGGTYRGAIGNGKGTYHAVNVSGAATVTIKDGTFCGPNASRPTTAESGAALTVQTGSTVKIYGGNFYGGKTKTLNVSGNLTISGGTFDQDPSAFDIVTGYCVDEEDGIYSVLPAIAQVENVKYAFLQKAIDAANVGDTVVLLASLADVDVTISKNVVLDLGGYTITDAYVKTSAEVTVQNGKIVNVDESYPLVVNSGTLAINNVAIEASKSDRAIWVRGGELVFNSGSILVTKGANNTTTNLITAIYTSENTTVTINGGTITVNTPNNKAVGIFGNYKNANVTVNGGKISTSGKNYSYGINVDGDITITGGEIVTNEKGYGYSSGIRYGNNYALVTATGDVTITGGKITTNGYSGYIVSVGRSYSSNDQTVTIKGGEFTNDLSDVEKNNGGHKAPVLLWEDSASNVTATITNGSFAGFSADLLRGDNTDLAISGGTFDVEINKEYCAPGFMTEAKGDGTYGVVVDPAYGKVAYIVVSGEKVYYTTLAEAIAAVGAGDVVIELIDDATLDYTARDLFGTSATTSLTINGNGHTLTLNQTNSDWASIGVAGGKLVLTNMTIEKTGHGDTNGAWNKHAIIFSTAVEMSDVTVNNSVAVAGDATLTNVTINEANGYYGLWIEANGQTVTMNGGAINATNGGRGIKIADEYVDAPASVTLAVENTEFNTAKKAAVLVTSTAGATITATGVDITNVAEDKNNFAWVDDNRGASFGKVTVNGSPAVLESADEFVAYTTVNGVLAYYKTVAEAIGAVAEGGTVTITKNVSGETIVATKSVTITGTGTVGEYVVLNNVSISGSTGIDLTVSNLSFTGNSWIDVNGAKSLTVIGVTANVAPANTQQTNSRSAFISLGRNEGLILDLTVEGCSIVASGGANPILGWASVNKVTLQGNTFGSAAAHQWNSDSVKFMSIANGAVINVVDNTVYSDYNGIVFAQNTTRDNAYTVNVDGNTFEGGADHIWIEISGGNTCHATVNATSNNTVNGNPFTAADIKAHTGVIKNWSSYVGVDVVKNADGKIIGGKLAFYAADLIAEGYECKPNGDVVKLPVAMVGDTSYTTIEDAIAKWTAGTTLTLLSDVVLSDVITLKSTEHHILNLSTFTMKAAEGKNAFEIVAHGTGDAERSALTIKADATNPGTLDAGNKSIVYYNYSKGVATGNDRPIIKIEGGIFNGATSTFGTAGIYTIGSAARKCATLNISGGIFNCSINGSGKSKLLISGGLFHHSVGSQGDSTALRLISGGTFKSFGFMTADSNNTKFWFGTKMGVSNVGLYINDEGYLVVGGPVINAPGEKFVASSNNYGGFSNYLKYSSAATNGLYYTSLEQAFADNTSSSSKVTVYVDAIDMTNTSFSGKLILANIGDTLTITFAEGTTPAWKVATTAMRGMVNYTETVSAGVVTRNYVVQKYVASVNVNGVTTYCASLADALNVAANGAIITLIYENGDAPIAMNGAVYGKTVTITGEAVVDWSKGFLFVGRGGEGDGTVIFDNAKLTSASNNASYGIHVSGREKNTTNKYDGTLTIKNSEIELDYLINKGTMTVDNSTLTVKNGFAVGGRPASETESGVDATATLDLVNGATLTVNNHNGMGLGYEAIGVMNVDATSTFKCTQAFLITSKGELNVNGDNVIVAGKLTVNGKLSLTNTKLENATIEGSGTTYFYGDINFYGTNSVTSGINGSDFELIVNKGATLLITRFVLGYNRNITVYGEIEDAHAFDPTGKTPSLKFNSTSGVSVGGSYGTGNLTVVDAYVELDNSSWKNAYGTYEWSFKNSYVSATSFTNCAARGSESAVWNVTFDDSVLAAKNYIKNGVGTTYNFINGSVATTGSLRIDGVLTIDATSSVTTTSQQNNKVGAVDEHGGINGTVIVSGTLTIGSNAKTQLEMLGGTLIVGANANVNLGNHTLTLDATSKLESAGNVTGAITAAEGATVKITGGTYTQDVSAWVVDGFVCEQNADGTYGVRALIVKTYEIGAGKQFATLVDAIAQAKAESADIVTYKLYGANELETGFSHGIVDFGAKYGVTIKGADADAKLTIVGGGVPDIKGVTLQNLKFADEGEYLPTANEFMYQNFIDTTFVNVTFEDGIRLSGNCTMTNCTVVANTANEYAIWLDEGNFEIKGSTVIVENGAYGMIKSDNADTITLTENVFTFTGIATKEALNVKGATIIATNNEFIDCVAGVLPADKTNYAPDGTTELTEDALKVNNLIATYFAQIGEAKYESLAAAFAAAQADDVVTILRAGTYSLSGIAGKNVTITGKVGGVVFDNIGAFNMGGASVTFNNVTFDYYPNVNYTGLQHSGDLVYNNCTFNGQVFLYGNTETFNKCTFNQNSADAYNVWTYGAKEVAFNECTFNSAGKSVLIYAESASVSNEVSVSNSTFNATSAVAGKAAIEMDSSLMAGIELTIDSATTATGFGTGNVSGNSLWNNKKDNNTDANNDIKVTVGGTTVLAPVTFVAKIGDVGYTTITEAIKAAQTGETVTILAGDYSQNLNVNKAITVVGETDAEGKNLVNFNGKLSITADGATVKNLNFNNSGTACYVGAKDVLIEGCTLVGSNGLYQSYTSGTVTFKNSTITGGTYGIHFDGSAGGAIVIDNCVITGWTSFAGTIKKVTMTGTKFEEGNYNYVRFYQSEVVIDGCTFNENMAVDLAVSGATVTVTNTTLENGNVEDLFYGSDMVNSTITVDGEKLVRVAKIGGSYYETVTEALAAAQAGDTIVLVGDANETIEVAAGQNLVIDLNGHDVVGTINAIVNNGTLTINDSVGTGNVYTTDVSAQGRATIVNNGALTINGGWYGDSNNDTTDRNAINRGNAIKNYGTAIINGGYFTNVSNQYINANAFAYAINTLAGGTTEINDATVYGDINGLIYSDGTTVVNGGSFTLGRPGEENNLWYLAYGNVEINGGTWNRAYKVPSWNTGDPKFSGAVEVSGGTFNVDATNWCTDGLIAIKNDAGIYEIKAGLKGSGTETDPYRIHSANELIIFRNSVNAGETKYNAAGVYVALAADIDLDGIDWSVNIGDDCNATFDGIFDGKNYTIKNLTSTETAQKGDGYICAGLFGAISGSAVIKNLTLENVNINTGDYTSHNVGAVVGFAYNATGSIENVHVKGNITINAAKVDGTGIIVGYAYGGKLTIADCSVIGNDGSAVIGQAFVGGIVGYAGGVITISNTTIENVTISATSCCVGGIAGIVLGGGSVTDATVNDVALSAAHENWQNSAAVVVGTISGGAITVANATVSGTTVNGTASNVIVGSEYAEHPTEPVPAIIVRVGDRYFTDLQTAINEANGETVYLLAPLTIKEGETVTIDLKGQTVVYNGTVGATEAMIVNKGTLTINDTVGAGTLSYTTTAPSANNAYASNTISNYGTITINGGVIANYSVGSACYALDNYAGSTATITGGTLYAKKTAVRIFNWTNGDAAKVTLTVNGGLIISEDGYGINVNSGNAPAVELNINGGAITTGDTDYNLAVYIVNKGTAENLKVNVKGGTFGGYFALNGVTSTTMKDGAVSISGGTFEGIICYGVPAYGFVSGGTYNEAIPENFCAEGYIPAVNTDGTYGVKVGAYVARNENTGVGYETIAEAFAAAQAGNEVEILVAGTYSLSGIAGKNITVTGAVDGVVFDNIGAFNMGGANVTFNNVTFDYYPNVNYTGLQHSGDLVYNNCTFNGQVFLYGNSETFNKCTFNQNSADAYNVWTYGAKKVAFNECTFNSAGKSVLIYAESASVSNEVSVSNSTFNATSAVAGKAAIEMDSSLTAGITLTIDAATTATGFGTGNVSGNSLWNNKKGNNTDANNDITVTVGGTTVLAPLALIAKIGNVSYTGFADALAAAKAGDEIVLLADVATTEMFKIEKAITLNLNGKTVTTTAKKAFEVYANFIVNGNGGKIVAAQRAIDTRAAVELKVTGVTLEATSLTYGNAQPLTIGGSENGTKVTLSGVTINAGDYGYAIISFVKTELTVENSTLNGYSAIYMKSGSANSEITLKATTINAIDTTPDNTDTFAAIVFEDSNVTLTADAASKMNASSTIAFGTNSNALTGITIVFAGDIVTKAFNSGVNASNNTITVKADYTNAILAEGYTVTAAEAGMVTLAGYAVASVFDANGNILQNFADLQDAIDYLDELIFKGTVTAGKITMIADVKQTSIVVFENITLDLAGHTLETRHFVVFKDGYVIDSNGDGLIKCAMDRVIIESEFHNEIAQMPIYDQAAGGYRLATTQFESRATLKLVNGKLVYNSAFYVGSKYRALVTDLNNEDNLSVVIRISWTKTDDKGIVTTYHEDIILSEELVSSIVAANSAKSFQVSLGNYANYENLTFQTIAMSGTEAISYSAIHAASAVTVSE